jgi:hypothetical protein
VLPPTPRYSVPLDERRRLGCSRRERMRLLVPAWIWNLAVSFGCCTRTISTGPVSCIDKGCYARSLVLKEHRVSPSIYSFPPGVYHHGISRPWRGQSPWYQPRLPKRGDRELGRSIHLFGRNVYAKLQNCHISTDTYKMLSAIPPQKNTYRNSSLRPLLSSAISAASSLSSTGSSTTT